MTAWAIAGFLWSLVVIALVTLLPTDPDVGIVPAEGRSTSCSMDYGGPAPDGFWIFAGGQRLLNTVLFVPAGALLVLAASRWRIGWVLVPLGLAGLAAYSVVIELIQLELARIDRACDVTDVVDNVSGALHRRRDRAGADAGVPAVAAPRIPVVEEGAQRLSRDPVTGRPRDRVARASSLLDQRRTRSLACGP